MMLGSLDDLARMLARPKRSRSISRRAEGLLPSAAKRHDLLHLFPNLGNVGISVKFIKELQVLQVCALLESFEKSTRAGHAPSSGQKGL